MDTNKLSEKILKKYQEYENKPTPKKQYVPRNSVRVAKRRKAIKGRKRLDCEINAENAARKSQAMADSYAYENETIIAINDDSRLERMVRQAIKEWASEEGLEVRIE